MEIKAAYAHALALHVPGARWVARRSRGGGAAGSSTLGTDGVKGAWASAVASNRSAAGAAAGAAACAATTRAATRQLPLTRAQRLRLEATQPIDAELLTPIDAGVTVVVAAPAASASAYDPQLRHALNQKERSTVALKPVWDDA